MESRVPSVYITSKNCLQYLLQVQVCVTIMQSPISKKQKGNQDYPPRACVESLSKWTTQLLSFCTVEAALLSELFPQHAEIWNAISAGIARGRANIIRRMFMPGARLGGRFVRVEDMRSVPRPLCCHRIRAGSNSSLSTRLLPMKLSSTKKTDPRQPARRRPSSSAIICAVDLRRGRCPNIAVMLQNSQSNALFRMNFKACLKLQKVSGNLGYNNNTFNHF